MQSIQRYQVNPTMRSWDILHFNIVVKIDHIVHIIAPEECLEDMGVVATKVVAAEEEIKKDQVDLCVQLQKRRPSQIIIFMLDAASKPQITK